MAAKSAIIGVAKMFSQLMWLYQYNYARLSGKYGNDNESKGTRGSLAQEGWLQDGNGMVEGDSIKNSWFIDGKSVPLEQFLETEMKDRERQHAFYRQQAELNMNKANYLFAWEKLFLNDKGKINEPDTVCITGNRRSKLYVEAMAERILLPDPSDPTGKKKLEIVQTIPVAIKDYSDQRTRTEAQTNENLLKTKGFVQSNDLDQLLLVQSLTAFGASQASLRNKFGVKGIKYYFMNLFNVHFPEVHIVDRCKKPVLPDNDGIPIPSVEYPVMQGFGQRMTVEDLAEYNKKPAQLQNGQKPLLSAGEVSEYFAKVGRGPKGETQAKAIAGTVMTDLGKTTPNELQREAFNAAAKNDLKIITRGIELAEPTHYLCLYHADGNDTANVTAILRDLVTTKKGELRDRKERVCMQALGLLPADAPSQAKHQANKKPVHAGK